MRKKSFFMLIILVAFASVVAISCSVSYKFNNAKLDYSVYKTISISDFPNRATLVYPPLYQEFNEKLKDVFTSQTKLQMVPQNGDYDISGSIVGYSLQQLSVGADGLAAQTKLIMTVRVSFTNNKDSRENFENTFTAQKEFSSSTAFESVQGDLSSQLVEEIIDKIFNATVASW